MLIYGHRLSCGADFFFEGFQDHSSLERHISILDIYILLFLINTPSILHPPSQVLTVYNTSLHSETHRLRSWHAVLIVAVIQLQHENTTTKNKD